MIKFETRGPWKKLRDLTARYDDRVKYAERRSIFILANAFLGKLKELVPNEEWTKRYVESFEIVELTGVRDKVAFGVVCKNAPQKVGEVSRGPAARRIGAFISQVPSEEPKEVVIMLTSVNPWPLDMLPHNIPIKDVSIVYRTLTDGEMDFARKNVSELITKNKDLFRKNGIKWGAAQAEDHRAEEMDGLHDYLFMAIRSEFGINAPSSPHWRKAMQWVVSNATEIVKKDEKIREALHDPLFREHTLVKKDNVEKLGKSEFMKEFGAFQNRIA